MNYWSPASLRTILDKSGYDLVEVVHESLDYTLAEVVRYLRTSSFTAVFPQKIGRMRYFFLALAYALPRLPPVVWLDRRIFLFVANELRMGSVLKLVAKKRATTQS